MSFPASSRAVDVAWKEIERRVRTADDSSSQFCVTMCSPPFANTLLAVVLSYAFYYIITDTVVQFDICDCTRLVSHKAYG